MSVINYKYDIGTKVKAKHELIILNIDDDTGEEYEIIIPEGSSGVIESWSRSSKYDKAIYGVIFIVGEDEMPEISFFEDDLENELYIESNQP